MKPSRLHLRKLSERESHCFLEGIADCCLGGDINESYVYLRDEYAAYSCDAGTGNRQIQDHPPVTNLPTYPFTTPGRRLYLCEEYRN